MSSLLQTCSLSVGTSLPLVCISSLFSFLCGVGIGANDLSANFAMVVGSGSLNMKSAIIFCVTFELLGAAVMGGHVSNTIRRGIVDPLLFDINRDLTILGMTCASFAAAMWLYLSTMFGLPVSITHTVVGSILGYAIVASKGFHYVQLRGMIVVVLSWVAAPLGAFVFTSALFYGLQVYVLQVRKQALQRTILALPYCLGFSLLVDYFFLIIEQPPLMTDTFSRYLPVWAQYIVLLFFIVAWCVAMKEVGVPKLVKNSMALRSFVWESPALRAVPVPVTDSVVILGEEGEEEEMEAWQLEEDHMAVPLAQGPGGAMSRMDPLHGSKSAPLSVEFHDGVGSVKEDPLSFSSAGLAGAPPLLPLDATVTTSYTSRERRREWLAKREVLRRYLMREEERGDFAVEMLEDGEEEEEVERKQLQRRKRPPLSTSWEGKSGGKKKGGGGGWDTGLEGLSVSFQSLSPWGLRQLGAGSYASSRCGSVGTASSFARLPPPPPPSPSYRDTPTTIMMTTTGAGGAIKGSLYGTGALPRVTSPPLRSSSGETRCSPRGPFTREKYYYYYSGASSAVGSVGSFRVARSPARFPHSPSSVAGSTGTTGVGDGKEEERPWKKGRLSPLSKKKRKGVHGGEGDEKGTAGRRIDEQDAPLLMRGTTPAYTEHPSIPSVSDGTEAEGTRKNAPQESLPSSSSPLPALSLLALPADTQDTATGTPEKPWHAVDVTQEVKEVAAVAGWVRNNNNTTSAGDDLASGRRPHPSHSPRTHRTTSRGGGSEVNAVYHHQQRSQPHPSSMPATDIVSPSLPFTSPLNNMLESLTGSFGWGGQTSASSPIFLPPPALLPGSSGSIRTTSPRGPPSPGKKKGWISGMHGSGGGGELGGGHSQRRDSPSFYSSASVASFLSSPPAHRYAIQYTPVGRIGATHDRSGSSTSPRSPRYGGQPPFSPADAGWKQQQRRKRKGGGGPGSLASYSSSSGGYSERDASWVPPGSGSERSFTSWGSGEKERMQRSHEGRSMRRLERRGPRAGGSRGDGRVEKRDDEEEGRIRKPARGMIGGRAGWKGDTPAGQGVYESSSSESEFYSSSSSEEEEEEVQECPPAREWNHEGETSSGVVAPRSTLQEEGHPALPTQHHPTANEAPGEGSEDPEVDQASHLVVPQDVLYPTTGIEGGHHTVDKEKEGAAAEGDEGPRVTAPQRSLPLSSRERRQPAAPPPPTQTLLDEDEDDVKDEQDEEQESLSSEEASWNMDHRVAPIRFGSITVKPFNPRAEFMFTGLQVVAGSISSFVHGAVAGANATAGFVILYDAFTAEAFPSAAPGTVFSFRWAVLPAMLGLAIGASSLGARLMKTVGVELVTVTPARGWCIQVGATLVTMMLTGSGIPVSLSQSQVGAAIGCGVVDAGKKGVSWWLVVKIISGWVITLFVSALTTGVLFYGMSATLC